MTINNVEFRIALPTGRQKFFPDWNTFTITSLLNDMGACQFTAPFGAVNFGYLYQELLAGRDVLCQFYMNGVHRPAQDFYITSMSGDDIKTEDDWTFSGYTTEYRMMDAVVRPYFDLDDDDKKGKDGTNRTDDEDPDKGAQNFKDVSAGDVMVALLNQAKKRGVMTDISIDFNGNTDSAGVAWGQDHDLKFAAGTSYLDVLKQLHKRGLCDWMVNGLTLKLFKFGSLSNDLTANSHPVTFKAGRDLLDSPRSVDLTNVANSVMGVGSKNIMSSTTDSAFVTNRGRKIERFVNDTGVKKLSTLNDRLATELNKIKYTQQEKTNGVAMGIGKYVPIADFDAGDWVNTDVGNGYERYRVQQWTMSSDKVGNLTGVVTLSGHISKRTLALADRLNDLVNGTYATGTSSLTYDLTWPSNPTNLRIGSYLYLSTEGNYKIKAQFNWDPPTTNTDGSKYSDHNFYEAQWKYHNADDDTDWHSLPHVKDGPVIWTGVRRNWKLDVRVRAIDKVGHASDWVELDNQTMVGTYGAPPKPSLPTLKVKAGDLYITWDGNLSDGSNPPPDAKHCEIHISTSGASFTPSKSTLVHSITNMNGGSYKHHGVYKTDHFVKLALRDKSNQLGVATSAVQTNPPKVMRADVEAATIGSTELDNGVVNTNHMVPRAITTAVLALNAVDNTILADGAVAASKIADGAISTSKFGDGSVTTTKLADLAVTTGKLVDAAINNAKLAASAVGTTNIQTAAITTALIANAAVTTASIANAAITNALIANLAVGNAQISDLSVAKITAGTLSASVTLSGTIATAATGARVVLDAAGLRAYDSSNNNTVNIASATGAASFKGTIASGSTISGATITGGTIQTASSGQRVQIDSSTQSVKYYSSGGSLIAYMEADTGVGYGNSGSNNSLLMSAGYNSGVQDDATLTLGSRSSAGGNDQYALLSVAGSSNSGQFKLMYNFAQFQFTSPTLSAVTFYGGDNTSFSAYVDMGNLMGNGIRLFGGPSGMSVTQSGGTSTYKNVVAAGYIARVGTSCFINDYNNTAGFGFNTANTWATVFVNGVTTSVGHWSSSGAYTATSTKRIKKLIRTEDFDINMTDRIRLVNFELKKEAPQHKGVKHLGVIAEELYEDDYLKKFVSVDIETGDVVGVEYDRLTLAGLIATNAKLNAVAEELEARVEAMESRMKELEGASA